MRKSDWDYSEFNMYAFGKELCELVKYKDAYYDILEKYESLQKEHAEFINGSIRHGEKMMGNFIELALYGIGGKPIDEVLEK